MIPSHEPDERLSSWFVRAERIGAFASLARASEAFFGNCKAGLKVDFPSHLDNLTKRFPNLIGDVTAVVEKATILPYLSRFREAAIYQAAIGQMAGASVAQLKFHLGLQSCAHGPRSSFRLCRTCLEADQDRIGVAYWHRVHQLPAVLVCPEHGEALVTVQHRVQDKQTSLFLPGDIDMARYRTEEHLSKGAQRYAFQLSVLSKNALEKPLPGGFNAESLYFTYRHGLKDAGFLTAAGRVRVASFEHAIRSQLSDLPSGVQLGRPETGRNVETLLDLIRGRRAWHPLSHLVLIDFLFDSWDRFSNTYDWEQKIRTSKAASGERASSIGGNSPLSSSVPKVRETGIYQEKLTQHRQLLLEYVKNHPNDNRKRVEKLCGVSWKWLYRNDRQWLEEHLPPPLPRGRYYVTWVDWEERDRRLSCHLKVHRDSIRFLPSERITAVTVLRKMPGVGFSMRVEKMPEACRLLDEIVEQHRMRRRVKAL